MKNAAKLLAASLLAISVIATPVQHGSVFAADDEPLEVTYYYLPG